MPDFPLDLQRAYETFTLLATHYDILFAGMAMRKEPAELYMLGNVTERGHNFAKLLRELANIVEEKADQNKVIEADFLPPESLN